MPKTKRRRGARLEMASLMDVMFLVLVFFIYCIFDMAVHKGLKVELPNTSGANEKGEKIQISVKDFGIGIPKESQAKIFERFYKSDLSRGKDKKGTGLGLSIVKDIITAHKEYIDVISTEGVGTEFVFALPLAHREEKEFPL